ncbi:MAG: AMP-binding protein [Thermaerobacter sp.]|nr:AMP-binding protein [Thermaerobacter sp.]
MNLDGYLQERQRFQWHVPSHFNMGTAIFEQNRPQATALMDVQEDLSVRPYTFGELHTLANRLGNLLRHLGIGAADRVGIFLSQSVELAVAHLAVYQIGAVAVPLFTLFGDDALSYRLNDAGVRVLIADGDEWPRLKAMRARWTGVERVIATRVTHADGPDLVPWQQIAEASPELVPQASAADDAAVIIYTSGTTGAPKGALHAHRLLLGHLPGVVMPHQHFPQAADMMWTPADWAWIGGLFDVLLPSLYLGVPVVAFRGGKFDPATAMDLLRRLPIRNVFFPPTALRILRNYIDCALPGIALRTLASGGEPLGEDLWDWIGRVFRVVPAEFYGQTEANLLIGNAPDLFAPQRASMGLPMHGHELVLLNEAGVAVGDGETGEICVQLPDPVAFLGYWNQTAATQAKTRGGVIHTGDLARRDAAGFFYFVGRTDDVINSSGYRIGPTEIEQVLLTHPAVSMVAVIGKPDAVRGEIVKAFIVPRDSDLPGREQLSRDLQDLVRNRLGRYEYPREIEYVAALPTTATGKIQRSVLRQAERAKETS